MDLQLRQVAEAGAGTVIFSMQPARGRRRAPYRHALGSTRLISADSQGDARCGLAAEGSGRFLRRRLEAT